MARGAMRFRNILIERQPQELARFRTLSGPDNGVVFVMIAPRITIGRGEDNDIILSDLQASRHHAEVIVNQGLVTIQDLGSAHGILVNGEVKKQIPLKSGDKIGLGTTVLEFIGKDIGATQILQTPITTQTSVGTGKSGLTQFIQKISEEVKKPSESGSSFLERNKQLLIILGALMAVAVLLPSVEQKQKAKKNQYIEPKELDAERSLGSLLPPQLDEQARKSADIYFREGFREYRAHNYTRALASFNTALQVRSDHPLSKIYLENTKKAMDIEAKEYLVNAKKNEEANRLHDAYENYDAVRRLYFNDQKNAFYKEANDHITELEKKMKEAKKD